MAVTHKVVVKMTPTARLELRQQVAKLRLEYHDNHGRLTQSSTVEACLYYWLKQATLEDQRTAIREDSDERTTSVKFRLTGESDLRTACGGEF